MVRRWYTDSNERERIEYSDDLNSVLGEKVEVEEKLPEGGGDSKEESNK